MAGSNAFLAETSERGDLNQYWFSPRTIEAFVQEIVTSDGKAALISTPSIFFSLPEAARGRSKVLDYDRQWSDHPGYVFYDFNEPESIPGELHNGFDFVLVDPPFITREVWAQYAISVRLLLRPGGRVLCTTIAENAEMLHELLGLSPALFRPSIPTLVYQYSVYTNYASEHLGKLNPEIDDEDWRCTAQGQTRPDHSEEILRESSKANVTLEGSGKGKAGPLDFNSSEGTPGATEAAPAPPEAELLLELRCKLNAMKKSAEGINAPLQTAIRRRQAGGQTSLAAETKAAAALDSAEAAAADLADWLRANSVAAAAAMGEEVGAFMQSLEQDRFRSQAVAGMVSRARGDGLPTIVAYNDFALSSKQHTAAVFRLSNAVMDRIKVLKRDAASAVASVAQDT